MAFNTFRCLKFLLKKIVLNFSAFAAEVFGVLSVSNAIILLRDKSGLIDPSWSHELKFIQTRELIAAINTIVASCGWVTVFLYAINASHLKLTRLINDWKNSLLTIYSRFIVFWSLSLIQVLSWMLWKVSWMPYKNSWLPYKISWMPYKSQTWMPYKFSWMPYKISWMPYKSNRDQKCSVCGLSCLLSTCIPTLSWNRWNAKKNLYGKLGNHGKIMQRKFCMACMEPYMALGYGCQERSTRAQSSCFTFKEHIDWLQTQSTKENSLNIMLGMHFH